MSAFPAADPVAPGALTFLMLGRPDAREQCPRDVERVSIHDTPGPVQQIEMLGVRPLAPHDRDRIGREKRVTAQRPSRGAVEEESVRKAIELFAAPHRIGWGHELFDKRKAAIVSHGNRGRTSGAAAERAASA